MSENKNKENYPHSYSSSKLPGKLPLAGKSTSHLNIKKLESSQVMIGAAFRHHILVSGRNVINAPTEHDQLHTWVGRVVNIISS